MTREEAIKILDPETRQETMKQIPVFERIAADQEACRLAVAALHAQQEPVKLERSMWEGCEWCKNLGAVILEGHHTVRRKKKYGSVIAVYCPRCGRPLTEDARAEMEGKIGGGYEKSDRN